MRLSDSLHEILRGEHVQENNGTGKGSGALPEEPSQPNQTEHAVTLEEVRAVLAAKSAAGHRAEVQTLIKECGADRLSAVDPSMYASLKAMAEVL